mmetsp:Transcript_5075/g.9030  ORF Transcript_5075/g.9030 Transcript_5075/m.9030 type:complete len:430 (-) Transcript_5075:84-1373(-)
MISQFRHRIPYSIKKNLLPASKHNTSGAGGAALRFSLRFLFAAVLFFFACGILLYACIPKRVKRPEVPPLCKPKGSLKCQAQQLDEILTNMTAEGRFKASVAETSKSEEAYATILYYPIGTAGGSLKLTYDFYMYACAAATLGLALKQIDPSRPRVALVTGLTEEAREILSDGDIWQLIDVPQWPAASVGGLPSSLAFGRKAALWDLVSYKRVLFLDSDAFIVPDNSGQRLKRLESFWQLEPLGKWHPYTFRTGKGRARAHDVKYNCIQSSHMLLEPASEVAERYRAILQDPPSLQFTDCIGQDQKVISYLFPFSLMLPIDLWRTSKYSGKECDVVLGEDPAVDEIHIFLHRFREEKKKVQPFWGGDCTSCILEGKRCRYSNAFTQPCHKIIIDWWWGRMMQLPSTTLNRCLKHHGANLHNVDQACYVV